nr:hypothetical protein [Thermoproteota archaeon]
MPEIVVKASGSAFESWHASQNIYAGGGIARALANAHASLARIVKSAWSRTRSIPRTRSGSRLNLGVTGRETVVQVERAVLRVVSTRRERAALKN